MRPFLVLFCGNRTLLQGQWMRDFIQHLFWTSADSVWPATNGTLRSCTDPAWRIRTSEPISLFSTSSIFTAPSTIPMRGLLVISEDYRQDQEILGLLTNGEKRVYFYKELLKKYDQLMNMTVVQLDEYFDQRNIPHVNTTPEP